MRCSYFPTLCPRRWFWACFDGVFAFDYRFISFVNTTKVFPILLTFDRTAARSCRIRGAHSYTHAKYRALIVAAAEKERGDTDVCDALDVSVHPPWCYNARKGECAWVSVVRPSIRTTYDMCVDVWMYVCAHTLAFVWRFLQCFCVCQSMYSSRGHKCSLRKTLRRVALCLRPQRFPSHPSFSLIHIPLYVAFRRRWCVVYKIILYLSLIFHRRETRR